MIPYVTYNLVVISGTGSAPAQVLRRGIVERYYLGTRESATAHVWRE